MTSEYATGAPRSAQELLWPLPPMCGVLGVALTWYLPDPDAGRDAARDTIGRQLVIWGLGADALVHTVGLVLDELIASAVRHGAGPLFLEINGTGDGVAVAVRAAGTAEWADPAGAGARGLEAAQALADELDLWPLPDGSGHAYVAVFEVVAPARGRSDDATQSSTAGLAPAASRGAGTGYEAGTATRRRPTCAGSDVTPTGLCLSLGSSAGPASVAARLHRRRRRTQVLTRTDGWPCQGGGLNATLGGPRGPTRSRAGPNRRHGDPSTVQRKKVDRRSAVSRPTAGASLGNRSR
ncbi:ATP-binding protein [Streptacidiphilus rugosus]|uniref:ATP-binding protein n=1 Tax=Streptacidiphilus rugosus TaxID=405783 RepID=UPI0006892BC5|nr:ATP-binding protein [Streptacidiphilus rugosus]